MIKFNFFSYTLNLSEEAETVEILKSVVEIHRNLLKILIDRYI